MHTHPREEGEAPKHALCTVPFLKWPGGKRRLAAQLLSLLPATEGRFIEPFVGAGALFAQSSYTGYLLSDANKDLCNLYTILRDRPSELLELCEPLFDKGSGPGKEYYERRDRFNELELNTERAALFIYLNHFGFNGLCRYNAAGRFNVPAGRRNAEPSVPKATMLTWSRKLKLAQILCGDFATALSMAKVGDVVFCDPPYAANRECFTEYAGPGFGWDDHCRLAECARVLAASGIPVLITNHDLPKTRALYEGATIVPLQVRRSISAAPSARGRASEIAALFAGRRADSIRAAANWTALAG